MKAFAICAATVLAVTIAIVFANLREPRYQGRTLTIWLQQCYDTPLMETQRLTEAQDAVRTIGAKKALPKLLKLVGAQEDPVSTWMIDKSEKWRIGFLHWRSADDFQQLGIAGFEALGTNATPAVGELIRLLRDKNHAFTAVRCLVAIGAPAEAGVSGALTNDDRQVRYYAAQQFCWVTDDDKVFLERMKDCLKDSDASVRFVAVQGIGAQTQAPDEAVPLLVEATKDSDGHVSSAAKKFLKAFGATNSPANHTK